jgi:hypothetical protein
MAVSAATATITKIPPVPPKNRTSINATITSGANPRKIANPFPLGILRADGDALGAECTATRTWAAGRSRSSGMIHYQSAERFLASDR